MEPKKSDFILDDHLDSPLEKLKQKNQLYINEDSININHEIKMELGEDRRISEITNNETLREIDVDFTHRDGPPPFVIRQQERQLR